MGRWTARGWLLAGALLLLIGLTFWLLGRTETKRESVTLSVVKAADGSESFVVAAAYQHAFTPSIISIRRTTSISDLELTVTHFDERGTIGKVFSQSFGRTWRIHSASRALRWHDGVVYGPAYVLPSAEILTLDDGQVVLVVWDGTHRVYGFNRLLRRFEPLPEGAISKDQLRRQYAHMFKLHDVYWSYGLVAAPEFWGHEAKGKSISEVVTSEELLRMWKKNRE